MVFYTQGMALLFHLSDSEIRDGATVQNASAPPSAAYERDAKQLDAWLAKLLEPGLIGDAGSEQDRVDPIRADKADSSAP